jgi:preprotein translocase subunit SecA
MNQQREVFYSQRNRIFSKEDLGEDLEAMVGDEVRRQ